MYQEGMTCQGLKIGKRPPPFYGYHLVVSLKISQLGFNTSYINHLIPK